MAITGQSFLKVGLLVAASAGLSGCVYDVGLGFASDGYHDDHYGCDPYGGYDAYYNCDYGQAFSNIGFGGGWYDNYYYPGHGIFLFDTFGRRYPMREQYRRYWGELRHHWHTEHRGRSEESRRHQSGNAMRRATGWPQHNGGPNRCAGEQHSVPIYQQHSLNGDWSASCRANAVSGQHLEVVRHHGRVRRSEDYAKPNRHRNDGTNAARVLPLALPGPHEECYLGEQYRGSAKRYGYPEAQASFLDVKDAASLAKPAPQQLAEPPRQLPRRGKVSGGAVEQPQ